MHFNMKKKETKKGIRVAYNYTGVVSIITVCDTLTELTCTNA
jgi:hypothetical protein